MILQTLDLLCPNAPVEIRILLDKMLTPKRFEDHGAAALWAADFPKARAIYTVMNPYDPQKITGAGVEDAAVTRRHWLLIDVDPDRPKDTNATDVELGYAMTVIARIQSFLTSHDWPAPVEALSGNGGHLLYRIDLPNDTETLTLIESVLHYLAETFDTPHAHVDTTVSNASRITKLYGTYARKGPETPERPARLSMITKVTEPLVVTPLAALQRISVLFSPTKPKKKEQKSRYDWSKVLARVEVIKTWRKRDVTYYQIKCPWFTEHSSEDLTGTILSVSDEGACGFKCQHGHCQERTWKVLRDHLGITTEAKAKRNMDNAILIQSGRLTEIVDQSEITLLKHTDIYQRGGQLTRAIKLDTPVSDAKDVRRDVGSTMLITVREPWLIEHMGQAAVWLKYDQKEDDWTPADPPPLYARTLLGRAEWKFPVLRGVVTAPTLTRDGFIVEAPGYDAKSGLLIDIPSGIFPPIPLRPSKEDAHLALARLLLPLRDFPFVDDAAKSVALSGLLCGLIRFSMRTAPLHSYDAPTAGTGKSLLAEMVGLLATGSRPPAMSQGKSEEEDEKRLSTVLFAGDPVIHIDNCERAISGDFLCSMLTQEVVQARILGLSERRILPSTALVLASGNNLIFAGDTSRRAVICRLDAGIERPDTRMFDFDCHEELLKQRPSLVIDALTILRAYHLDDRPCSLTPMGSFTDYEWVRGALVWLDCADPAETRLSILANDPRKDELILVMEMWERTFGATAIDVAEIERRALPRTSAPDAVTILRDKLVEVCCRNGNWSGKSVGWWLRRNKDRVVGGRCLRCFSDGRQNEWALIGAQASDGGPSLGLDL